MKSILMKIQDSVGRYADVMSKIAGTDVEVMDTDMVRVAGTGMFAGDVNRDISGEAYVYKRVLETGEREIILSPGEEPVCRGCPHYRNCPEEIEISMPVRSLRDGRSIGVIGLVGSSPEQKTRIMEAESTYLDLLEQIANFISAKAGEEMDRELQEEARARQEDLLATLRFTINYMEQGALILDDDGRILQINQSAADQLELGKSAEGMQTGLFETGDRIGNETEYQLKVDSREYLLLGNKVQMPGDLGPGRTLLLFRGSHEVREQMREIGAILPSEEKSQMIGRSPATQKLKEEIRRVARSRSTVLITGKSGTGKEMVATSIWRESDRSSQKFIAINCAAIPEAILESELFGYVKGAFTGADPNGRKGKFELADKGVIFLDEIGDMPIYLQSKLLRVLQERKIVRIGSNVLTPVDVRVLAATNRDLKEMIREGKFREDLYYRLNVIPLHIEALKDRKEDIEDLVLFFAARFSRLFEKPAWRVTDRAMDLLRRYSWPGNVRELENVVEYMVNMMGSDGVLGEHTLPRDILLEMAGEGSGDVHPEAAKERGDDLRSARRKDFAIKKAAEKDTEAQRDTVIPLRELERREIRRALEIYGTSTAGKRKAAASLGISLATLYRIQGTNSQNEN